MRPRITLPRTMRPRITLPRTMRPRLICPRITLPRTIHSRFILLDIANIDADVKNLLDLDILAEVAWVGRTVWRLC